MAAAARGPSVRGAGRAGQSLPERIITGLKHGKEVAAHIGNQTFGARGPLPGSVKEMGHERGGDAGGFRWRIVQELGEGFS